MSINKEAKCHTCVGKYNYKTTTPCRYCKWNTYQYQDRKENLMVKDNYHYSSGDENSDIPY